jgi:hypothetical protein
VVSHQEHQEQLEQEEQPVLFNLFNLTTETKSRSPGGAGQVNQPQAHHRSKTSTSTNHLGAGVRYKQDQPEQNSVLLINKHTLASQKQSGYETLFASSSGY